MEKIFEYIEKHELKSRSKLRQMNYKRFYLYDRLRKEGYSLYDIGEFFDRTHSTVIYGIRTHEGFLDINDKMYLESIKELQMLFEIETPSLEEDVMRCGSLKRLDAIKIRILKNYYENKKELNEV